MKYQEFKKKINYGTTTAFVYDSSNNCYNYSIGEINEDTFENTTPSTDYQIEEIDKYPTVKKVIIENFLIDIAPAAGIQDDGYDYIKNQIENGNAKLGIWENKTKYGTDIISTTVYLLIL